MRRSLSCWLHCSAFLQVFQVRKKDTGEIFAMKVCALDALCSLGQLEPRRGC